MRFKKISTLLVAGALSASAFAAAHADSKSSGKENNNFAVMFRAGALHDNGKLKYSNGSSGKLRGKIGMNFELASNYFFTSNVATELSLGYRAMKETTSSKSKTFNFIPLTGTVQYHFMPNAGFSPYVGAGYGYTFVTGKGNSLSVKSAGSPVVQAGFNVPMSDSTFVNVDAKYGFTRKHNIKDGSIGGKFRSKPLSVMVGVGSSF